MLDKSSPVLFVLSLMALSVIYGAAAYQLRIFPYSLVRNALLAAEDLRDWVELALVRRIEAHPHVIDLGRDGGAAVPRHDPARAYAGLTLVESFDGHRFGLTLLDMAGEIRHRWTVPDQVYREIERRGWPLDRGHYEIMGTHLFDNGDVLVNLSFKGLAKIDRCSNLIWFLGRETHHDQDVEPDGTIWVLARETVVDAAKALPHFNVPYDEDVLLRLTPDGRVTDRISVLDALFAGDYQALVLEGEQDYPESATDDPTHANDIEIVDQAFAGRHDFATPGDILVSLRTVDAIVLIDRQSRAVKWAMAGLFLRQHDPDLLADGTISILDNRTDRGQHNQAVRLSEPQSFGYSRILRVDPVTQKVVWQYQGSVDEPFYTSVQGDHQVLANGNVMVVESEAGRIFEVDPATNQIVWEWINYLDIDGRRDLAGRITRATRLAEGDAAALARACP